MNIPQISQTTPVSSNRRNVTSPPATPSRGGLQNSKGRDQSLPVTALATHINPDSVQRSEGNKFVENSTPLASLKVRSLLPHPSQPFVPLTGPSLTISTGVRNFVNLTLQTQTLF